MRDGPAAMIDGFWFIPRAVQNAPLMTPENWCHVASTSRTIYGRFP
jgi:hypothetical protein